MPKGMTAGVRSERYESWVAAQSKNMTEAKLLAGRLRDLDRERAQSIHQLNVEKRFVKKEHNKLLRDRRTLVGSQTPVAKSRTPNQPANDVWIARDDDARIQTRIDAWVSSLSKHHNGGTTAAGLPPINEYDEIPQSDTGVFMTSVPNRRPKRPATRALLESTEHSFDNMALSSPDDSMQKPLQEDKTQKAEKTPKDARRTTTRRRQARAEVDRTVQSKMSRLKALSRVPAQFDLRAKEASVSRSGRPQLDMNYFHENHHQGPSRPDQRRHTTAFERT